MTDPEPKKPSRETVRLARRTMYVAVAIVLLGVLRVVCEVVVLAVCVYAWDYAGIVLIAAFMILKYLEDKYEATWLRLVEDGVLWPAVLATASYALGVSWASIAVACAVLVGRTALSVTLKLWKTVMSHKLDRRIHDELCI